MGDSPGTSSGEPAKSPTKFVGEIDDDDENSTISLADVLEEENQLEADANAVLGDSNDTHCTYEEGYKLRQALYACLTCTPCDMEPAGVCLACCLRCHESHELVELYTRRHFRCDCGNNKFPSMTCKLYTNKAEKNVENKYNQNFRGVYCTCHRPYPDPEDQVEDEMVQCCICEDWYHGRHIGRAVPAEYDEFICSKCMKKNSFLYVYTAKFPQMAENGHQNGETASNGDTSSVVDIESSQASSASSVPSSSSQLQTEDSQGTQEKEGTQSHDTQSDDTQSDDTSCKMLALKAAFGSTSDLTDATFWPEEWRSKLCKCEDCKKMFAENDIEFLFDMNDTIVAYETRGKSRAQPSQYENGMQALQQMDRVQQIEVISEFNSMKDHLKEYLKKFADNKKVVREEDIQEFFEDLKARKKPKTDMPYYCK